MQNTTLSLSELFETRFLPLRCRNRSKDTIRLYRHSINQLSKHLGRPATIEDFNDLTISAYLAAYSIGRSPHTIDRERTTLLAFWRWCCKKSLVREWPDIEREKLPERIPEAWTEEQIARIFEAVQQLPGKVGTVRACDWWECLHWLAWDTGERIGALLGLKWVDCSLTLDSPTVICRAETRKGGLRDKMHPISNECASVMVRVRAQSSHENVLHWPYVKNYIWPRYAAILKSIGLPHDRKSLFHRLRKSVATHLTVTGRDATKALDHSSPSVTKAYIDPRIAKQEPIHLKLFRPTGERADV